MISNTHAISSWVWLAIAVQTGWLVWALMNFVRRNDEFPVVMAGFLAYCGSYRFLGAYLGFFEWGSFEYGLGVTIDFGSAGKALEMIVLGQSVLLASYLALQEKISLAPERQLPALVVTHMRYLLLLLAGVGLPVVIWSKYYTQSQILAGKSLAFEVSGYVQQLPMLLVALALFLFLAWRFGALLNFIEKGAAVLLLLVIGYLTFGTSGRFIFLGWIIGGSYIISTRWFGLKRIPILLVGGLIALSLFGLAGAMRDTRETDLTVSSFERTKRGEDANMLDGMVLLMNVYPKLLPYEYGMGHFEILERPIPRAWWPGKPIGGYMNKLGFFDAGSGGTIGISPTLFGSFYQEGNWVAIILFSVIYGWALARLVRFSSEIRPVFGVLLRAGLIAGLIPLLRGGDLPGIYAWLGMAFWPLGLFLWWNREYLRPITGKSPGRHGNRNRGVGAGVGAADRRSGHEISQPDKVR